MAKKKKEAYEICKVAACSIKARREGFCINCYAKYIKGYYDFNGGKSLEAAKKEQAQKEKDKKKARKARAKQWAIDKDHIARSMSRKPHLLKVIQEEFPETTKTKWCKALEFWTCDAVCYNRMFLIEYPAQECIDCHVYDDKFEWLKEFIEENNDKRS